jgi:acyl-homoserine-lactone acylase
MSRTIPALILISMALTAACAHAPSRSAAEPTPQPATALPELAQQVEIRRTTWGVPQIHAENLRAAAFALAYVQLEDYGIDIVRGMYAARGELARLDGAGRIDADVAARQRHARARETWPLLHADTRDVYAGFAEGMNHYIQVHADRLPGWVRPDIVAEDVLARDIGGPAAGPMNAFRRRLLEDTADVALLAADGSGGWRRIGSRTAAAPGAASEDDGDDVGSNAWALAPHRTRSGHAMLMRNPHLAWSAGYYEAHLRVPGRLDFYGDFRIGGPFTVIGGFNRHLGFSTTNNATRSHEFYALRAHPTLRDHVLLDGAAVPLQLDSISVEYRAADGIAAATREVWTSPLGPIVHRTDSLVYVYRPAAMGEYRAGEQWLEMMKATSLDEWRDAMRIGARTTSNFTYADRAGNIFYAWVSGAPLLPHPAGGDSLAILVTRSDQAWSRVVQFDALPQLLNPPGGYIRNENDSPHYTNLNQVLPDTFSFWVEPPRMRLRSQHGHLLLHNDRVFSLEDAIEAKHSMRMLLADRVKPDLLTALGASRPTGEVRRAVALLEQWDNTVAAGSRGGVLFEAWWARYRALMGSEPLFAVEWSMEEPATTPHGLASPERAAEAFAWAVDEVARRHGAWDVAWGDVHRVQRGSVDVPVGGCAGALGCFRVLTFTTAADNRRIVDGGDGWVLAVEFGDEPRAYSVLAYGQSPDPASPHHADQAVLFAEGQMKPVFWTEDEISRATIRRYHPGNETRPPR